MRLKDIVNESIMLSEKQFKGLEGIPANKSLEKISNAEKLNIIKAKGNIINFIVPAGMNRNFWQVISTGSIKKSSSGNIVMLMGQGPMNSPSFKTIDDLIDGVDWKAMEQRRRFNEGVTEAQYNHNNANVKDHPTIVPKTYLAKLPKGNLDGYIVKNGNGFMVAIIDRKNKLQLSGGTTNSIRDAVFFLKKKGFDLQPLIDMGMMKPKNESVTEAKEIKWQDVEVGDSANVTATNKTGVIVKTYGRKFHLKFVDGTTKTFDANELSFVKQEGVNEGKYYIGYNKGRGQGTGVFKDVFSTYKDAKKELEKIEKQRGGSYNQIAYYVADEKGNFVREAMLGEGRGIKSIQNDLDKTVVAIESEIASYKKTKGTPQEKKHIDNLKKLHPIKKKLQSELDMAVSGLYRDAELKIED